MALNALLEIQQLLLTRSNVDDCLDEILMLIGKMADVDRVCWFEWQGEAAQPLLFHLQSQWATTAAIALPAAHESVAAWPEPYQTHHWDTSPLPLTLASLQKFPLSFQDPHQQASLILPLTMQGQCLGYLRCDRLQRPWDHSPTPAPTEYPWSEDCLTLLHLATQAITLRLAQIYTLPYCPTDPTSFSDHFFTQSVDPCCIAGFDGYFKQINPAWLALTGYPADELLNQPYLDLVHPDDQASTQQAAAQLAQGQGLWSFQNRYRCRDGTYRWLAWNSIANLDDQVIYAIARDITQQKEAEFIQQESQQRLEAAQDLANVGDWELDLITGRITWSRQLFRIFGLNPDDEPTPTNTLQSSAFVLRDQYREFIHPDDRDRVETAMQNAIQTGQAYELEYRIIRPDQDIRYLLVRGQPIISLYGQVVRLFGTALDITRQKQVEHRLSNRFTLEQLITSISTQFINLDWADIDPEIESALGKIGEFTSVDRSYVCLITDQILNHTHVWQNPVISCGRPICTTLNINELPWLLNNLVNLEVLSIPAVADLPPEAALEQDHWQSQQIHALILVPMVANGDLMGFVGFDSIEQPRCWQEEDVLLLRLVGEIFANAMQRMRTELALSDSESRFRQLAENIQSVFWMVDPRMKQVLYISPPYASIWGRSCAELYRNSQDYLEAVHPDDRAAMDAFLKRQAEGPSELEYRIIRPDGEVRWIRDRAFPIENAAGEVYRITGIAEDISTRKFTEAAIQVLLKNTAAKLGAAFFRSLVQHLATVLNVSYAFVAVGLDHPPTRARTLALFAQNAIQDNFDYDLVGTPCATLFQEEDVSFYPDHLQEQFPHDHYLQTEQIQSYAGVPLNNSQGQMFGYLAIMDTQPMVQQDLPLLILQLFATRAGAELERLQAEDQRQRSEERLQLALEGSNLGLWDFDYGRQQVVHNAQYWNMLGYPLQNQFTDWQAWHNLVHPDDLPQVQTQLERHVTGQTTVYQVEFRMRHRLGHWVWIASHGKVFDWDAAGRPLRMTGTHMDISDRKQMEQMKDELISVISHELRTPMTSLQAALKLIRTGKLGQLTAQGERMLDIAVANTERLCRLVNDILDLQRLEAGQSTLMMVNYSVAQLLQDAIAAMQSLANAQNLRFEVNFPPADLTLWGDPDYLAQVLTNLISNAVKFSPPDSTITLTGHLNAASMVEISIQDHGRGIPEEQFTHIFERFRQVDGSDSRQKGGTGLGLAICQQIIEQHGGQIWVESVVGQGSTFYFTVPTHEPPCG
ncbi:PAS domain-containing protein [Spirulina major CS-329]|uniref:PAS domain-containing protein n=1 Tax=Spirulina TaxID=1154 RepID=UPI00232AC7E0|nr:MULTISPECIES: PAS domain-containing protein [Spirulina]MDB9494869.1 PAS domain-containing protein [Spirulina subsalsa CS-330]MDB9501858.1 PAS domain-containing protein [Spirulina major CS-329]